MFVQRIIIINRQEKVIEIQIFKLLVSKLSPSFELAHFDIAGIPGMYFIALCLCKDSLSKGSKKLLKSKFSNFWFLTTVKSLRFQRVGIFLMFA